MKLVPKLTVAFIAATTLVLGSMSFRRIRRDSNNYRVDRDRDVTVVARAVSDGVAAVWESSGEGAAAGMVSRVGAHEDDVRVRWVCGSGSLTPLAEGVGCADLVGLARGSTRLAVGEARGYAYAPVEAGGASRGAIEVSASLMPERGFVRRTVIDAFGTTVAVNAVFFGISFVLGLWFVARPTRALIEKARRVGRGDFGGPLLVEGRDEFAELAKEMNAMCAQLAEAHARVQAESAARVSAMDQLRHADRLTTVGKLASGLAHELGTPINVVEARATMIASGEADGETARAHAKVVVEQCDRMTHIIGALLAFARRRGAEKTDTDLGDVARRSIELIDPIARKRGVRLRIDAGHAHTIAAVDAIQLQQALTNLVVNAVQASADGKAVEVSVGRERAAPPADHGGDEQDYACIRVADEGAGIAREDVERIFEPFYTTKEVGEGTGLGLSVAYGIVRDHGGWIAVQSEAGRGSRFSIYLPPAGGVT